MEFHGIEKLRGAENWHIWKFAVKNLLRGIEGAYEVCIGELLERELAEQGESPEQGRLLWVGKNVVFEPENTGKLLTLFPVETQEVLPNQEANEPIVTADATAGESSSASIQSNEDEVPISRLPSAGMTLRDRRFLKTPKRLVEMIIIESDEPRNFAEAVTSDEASRWRTAMNEKMTSLEENSTWELHNLPERYGKLFLIVGFIEKNAVLLVKLLDSKLVWLFVVFRKGEGIDYTKAFSPVARFDTIRAVLSIAADEKLELSQFDVKTAFLHDDGIVAATNRQSINIFLDKLGEEFQITVDTLGCFLNVQIERSIDGTIHITQKRYIEDVLRRFRMDSTNPVSTPIEKCEPLDIAEESTSTSAPYREAVGCLMYLTVATRPDIAFAVAYVSRFLEKPKERHWSAVKCIFKYLRGTSTLGIRYDALGNAQLEAYSDSDFASDPDTRRSVSGIVFKYSGGAIVWASRRQQSVSLSTTEAEYVAASEAAKDVVWLTRLFNEIAPFDATPVLQVDKACEEPYFSQEIKTH
ncbi:hypothetical protein GEV33_007494 [Tenebrio molitor]|uniref:Reverse transcriptase Ty1/copia-type domain-containing protein n=1 Tax=Tenebrio molitor TaxID=7067 RepID=A0A8J6HIJ8_TENMO|nr:hypothetical protein GEV33_007494 [Tenebrio molitor]